MAGVRFVSKGTIRVGDVCHLRSCGNLCHKRIERSGDTWVCYRSKVNYGGVQAGVCGHVQRIITARLQGNGGRKDVIEERCQETAEGSGESKEESGDCRQAGEDTIEYHDMCTDTTGYHTGTQTHAHSHIQRMRLVSFPV